MRKNLEHHIVNLLKDLPGNHVLLDHYLDKAIEAEADAICDGKDVVYNRYDGTH